MKAAVIEKPGRLLVRNVQEPQIGEYDAFCELLFGSTCTGTDQHIIDNLLPWPIVYPTVLGHESIGRVVEIGSKVRHFQIGDIVTRVGTPPPQDGSTTVTWGGFTEYGIARDHWQARRDGLPVSFWDAHRVNQIVPAGIDPAAATMIITLRETLSYVSRMGFAAGKSVLVIGSGGTGLAFVSHARHMGLKPIACVGSDARQPTARAAGASLWADYRSNDAVEQLSQQHPTGFDFIIDSIGREGSLSRLVSLLAPTGVRSSSCGSQDPVADRAVLQLAASLREAELVETAERLERAYDREARIVALDVPTGRRSSGCSRTVPRGLLELRATLLQEHVWRRREGLARRLDVQQGAS